MATKKPVAYVVYLSGQGDVDIRIVDQATWDWINSPVPSNYRNLGHWEETIPSRPQDAEEFDPDDEFADPIVATITCGSYENDRAINCYAISQGYETRTEAKAHLKKLGYTFGDTYMGCIY
jgi:hypothetical protein